MKCILIFLFLFAFFFLFLLHLRRSLTTSGKRQNQFGQASCEDCAIGRASLKVANNQTECESCKKGRTTFENGSIVCSTCSAGRYKVSTSTKKDDYKCDTCQVGTVALAGATTCDLCDPGYYQQLIGQSLCTACRAGTWNDITGASSNSSCIACTQGRYSSAKGASDFSSCNECAPGKASNQISSNSSTSCLDCDVNEYSDAGATQCSFCSIGQTTTKKGTAYCSNCDLGRYGTTNGLCKACNQGQYQDARGSNACNVCPEDTYGPATGQSSKADCQSCSEDKTTGNIKSAVDSSSCSCRRNLYYQTINATCLSCPDGANCSHHDGIGLHQIVASNGYWRPNSTSTLFVDCREGYRGSESLALAQARCCPPDKCNIDAPLNSNGTMFNSSDEQCLKGYSGALCLVCQKDYVFIRGGCEFCMGGAIFSSAVAAMISFCICVAMFVLVILLWAPSKKTQGAGDNYFGQLKIILSFVQILAAIPGVYDNVPWPTLFIDFTIPLNFMNFEFLSLLMESTCSLAVPFLDQFVLHMCLPVVLLLSIGMAYVVSRCCIKSVAKRKRGNELISQILILGILLLYPGLATRIFSVWRCKEIEGVEGRVLVADFSIKCENDMHLMYSGIALACLCLFILGIPIGMMMILWRHRKDLHNNEDSNNEDSKRHELVKASLGGLYLQCKLFIC